MTLMVPHSQLYNCDNVKNMLATSATQASLLLLPEYAEILLFHSITNNKNKNEASNIVEAK